MFGRKKDKTSMKDLQYLHGKRLSYCVERFGSQEQVLGRQGGISVSDTELVIVCNGTEVFRCLLKSCVAAELMSHNGVDIKGEDSNGKRRHVIAYYSNLRQ